MPQLSPGETAPDFTLPGTAGAEIETYRLSDHLERGPVVLTFYPFDFSPVCTDQLCSLSEAEWLTVDDRVDVFGISVDSAHAHRRFIEEYDLLFPLLSDRLGDVAEAYDVLHEEWEEHPRVSQRAVLAIDRDRTVRYRWSTENSLEQPTLDEMADAVEWWRNEQSS